MIEELVDEVFKAVLEYDELPPKASLKKDLIAKWDSMALLNMVSAFENELDITIDLDDATSIDSYDKAIEVLKKYT